MVQKFYWGCVVLELASGALGPVTFGMNMFDCDRNRREALSCPVSSHGVLLY